MMRRKICYVTEVDLDDIGGAVTNDMKMIRCLQKFGDVNVIYLAKKRCSSIWLALASFIFQILRSFSKSYILYFSRGLINSCVLMLFKPIHGKKVVHNAHSVPFPSREVHYATYHNRLELLVRYCLFRFLEKTILPHVDEIVAAADEYAEELEKAGVARERISIIHYYVENDFFKQPIKRYVNGVFKFSYIGRFYTYHDLIPLIQAFQLVAEHEKGIQLLMVGDGVLRSKVENEITERKLTDRAKLVGMFPHSAIPFFLSKVDCFVFLTRASGIPISLLEAAAAGKAIISLTRKQDITLNRYFRHGKEIYMVNTLSIVEIAKALELLYSDQKLRDTLAIGARKVAQEYFSEKVVLRQLEELISKISLNNSIDPEM